MASLELQKVIQGYENFISVHGISEDVINAYVQAVQVAFLNEKDIEYGLKISARAKSIINQFSIENSIGIYGLLRDTNKTKN